MIDYEEFFTIGGRYDTMLAMATEQTLWVQQWARYSEIAKSQDAPPEFWVEYKKISVPSNGQVTESHIIKLKALMANYKLHL